MSTDTDYVTKIGDEQFIRDYRKRSQRKIFFVVICLILAFVTFLLTISVGHYDISTADAYRIFVEHLTGEGGNGLDDTVVWDMWTPRALMSILVGASLAVGGAVMQNLLRNPLAEPYTMGVSSGAFLGAVLAMTCGISIIPFLDGSDAIVVNAFLFSLIPIALIIIIAKYRNITSTTMILSGISIMYILSALSTLLMVMATPTDLSLAYNWRIGTLGRVDWDDLIIVAPCMLILMLVLISLSGRINALSQGDHRAISLGVDPYRSRLVCLIVCALLTAFAVCFTGTIGFIGLVCPHMVRAFIGSNNRYLLPACAGFGALFLVFLDSISKVVGPAGMPVGVVTALIGCPLFIYILIQRKRKVWY